MAKSRLSQRLVRARKIAGLTLYQAAELMPHTSYQTLYHLEGRTTRPTPSGEDIQLKTAIDIVRTYWPDIQLVHLMPEARTIEFARVEGAA